MNSSNSATIDRPPRVPSHRYDDGYRTALRLKLIGTACKVVGVILWVFFFMAPLFQSSNPYPYIVVKPTYSVAAFVGSFLSGALVAFVAWVVGTVVAAFGEILRASLDTAVNTAQR
jgi:hypothetical protein